MNLFAVRLTIGSHFHPGTILNEGGSAFSYPMMDGATDLKENHIRVTEKCHTTFIHLLKPGNTKNCLLHLQNQSIWEKGLFPILFFPAKILAQIHKMSTSQEDIAKITSILLNVLFTCSIPKTFPKYLIQSKLFHQSYQAAALVSMNLHLTT